MPGNKAFTQEGCFINKLICSKTVNNFVYNDFATPDTVAASLSPSQVTGLQLNVTGAQADTNNHQGPNHHEAAGLQPNAAGAQADIYHNPGPNHHQAPNQRRSRRLAGLPSESDGIT